MMCLLICVSTLEIDKSDGGYRDLLISINKDVPYNETIVENVKGLNLLPCLQSLFRSSSQFLHRATNGLVYFKHVTINFPSTWPKRSSARRLSSSLFEKGDVRIDLPAESQEQERPFTKQWKLCGKPGEYIKVTPTFLAELNDSTTKTFGNPAYVFVHEWAHYRYGVFDEHGWRDDEKYPLTYCEEDPVTGLRELKLNACSSKFTFDLTLDSGDSCPLNKTTCTFYEKCVMRIKTDVTDTVESSIMFMPYVANVSHFCDSTNGARQHNPYAPSEQNAICRGRSTWEVISENEDFTNLARANLSKRIETTFEETQHTEDLLQRVVMALDVSDSMKVSDVMSQRKYA
ncbi:calcium-activated chloride channel regulator 2-like [Rhipicephalus microplus]|uniref:calcium-activated chloride channel regulator 2-like n=1 Tax=Rhipicephalus microplus TaxID=6941 RepID=UPI003F6D4297